VPGGGTDAWHGAFGPLAREAVPGSADAGASHAPGSDGVAEAA